MAETALYLIPVQLSDGDLSCVLPASNIALVSEIKYFIVENVRSARRFLKKCNRDIDIDSLTFYELNRHTDPRAVSGYLAPLEAGNAMGVISEAGCPAIADPGADVVALAQRRGLRVKPLVGPSSVLMGLMGSGFNGQSFAFLGYLPIEAGQRARKLKEMERRILKEDQTQIFIETPYRNDAMFADLLETLSPSVRLCVAADLTLPDEFIRTQSVREWRTAPVRIGKRPCVFLFLTPSNAKQ